MQAAGMPPVESIALWFGSPIACDGARIGHLWRLRLHPCCGVITQLVVRRPWRELGRRVVLPIRHARLAGAGVAIVGSPAALAGLPGDTPMLLQLLGADFRTPQRSAIRRSPDRIFAAHVHEAFAVIGGGMAIVGQRRKLGCLAGVLVDPSLQRVAGLLLRRPGMTYVDRCVPIELVAQITPRRIVLSGARTDLADLPLYHHDAAIAAMVRTALRQEPAFRAGVDWIVIQVACRVGVVSLRGNVRTLWHRYRAEAVARATAGVRAVHTELTIDEELRKQVMAALRQEPRLADASLQIAVTLGLVELRGQVADAARGALAIARVRAVPGVRAINNELVITASATVPTDRPVEGRWADPRRAPRVWRPHA